jgi:hypothetical protein
VTLSIFIEKNQITLKLLDDKRTLDFETFSYYHNIDEELIKNLDKLIKRNNIDTSVINSFKIKEDIGKNTTAYKITMAFMEGLKATV